MSQAGIWSHQTAPGLADIHALAVAAFARLPAEFRAHCKDLIVRAEEFPADDALEALDMDDPFSLLGLYQGVDMTSKSVWDAPHGPDMVFLYRRPLLDYWAGHGDTLGQLIAHVLIHEIGHHFGFSDADMEALELQAMEEDALEEITARRSDADPRRQLP